MKREPSIVAQAALLRLLRDGPLPTVELVRRARAELDPYNEEPRATGQRVADSLSDLAETGRVEISGGSLGQVRLSMADRLAPFPIPGKHIAKLERGRKCQGKGRL